MIIRIIDGQQYMSAPSYAEQRRQTSAWCRMQAADGKIPGAIKLGGRWWFPVGIETDELMDKL